jgi:hypothetical protein
MHSVSADLANPLVAYSLEQSASVNLDPMALVSELTYLWLTETSQQPTGQTIWLKVTPLCNPSNHLPVHDALWPFFSEPMYLWPTETSQQPTGQTIWLKVTPLCNPSNHLPVRDALWPSFSEPMYLWLTETSQQPTSQIIWLKVTPLWYPSNHLPVRDALWPFFSELMYLWLTETSQQPTSQIIWMKVTPHCIHSNHLPVCKVGQSCVYTPYMTVYLITSLQKIPYIHRIYGSGQPYLYVMSFGLSPNTILVSTARAAMYASCSPRN